MPQSEFPSPISALLIGHILTPVTCQPESITIMIEFVKFEGTILERQKAKQPYQVAASCANQTGSSNEVTPEALELCLGPEFSIHQISQWAEKETLNVTIGWRPEPNAILAETLHTVRKGQFSQPHGVTFAGNIDFVLRAASHVADVTRATDATMAAMSASSYGVIYSSPEATFNTTYRSNAGEKTPDTIPWSQSTNRGPSLSPQYSGPLSDSGVVNSGTIARATRRPRRQQDRRRTQTSRLVQTYSVYADDVFKSTGDASEVIRALELSRLVAASQIH